MNSNFDEKTATLLSTDKTKFDPSTAKPYEPPKTTGLGLTKDIGLSLAKGAASLPGAIMAMPDALLTGGKGGKFLEDKGLNFGDQAQAYFDKQHTDALKTKREEFEQAGSDEDTRMGKILDKAGYAISNPSLLVNTAAESIPSMIAGAKIGRAVGGKSMSGEAAGALGEGYMMAGQAAEEIRSNTEDRLLTPEQTGLAGLTGVAGWLFSLAGNSLAKSAGSADVDTLLANGMKPTDIAKSLSAMPPKSIPSSMIKGAISEGLLEELPQTITETALQNIALGKDWDEGIEGNAVLGALTGGMIGGLTSGAGAAMSRNQSNGDPELQDQGVVANSAESEPFNSGGSAITQPVQDYALSPEFATERPYQPTRAEQAGLNPDDGSLSEAASVAVNGGAALLNSPVLEGEAIPYDGGLGYEQKNPDGNTYGVDAYGNVNYANGTDLDVPASQSKQIEFNDKWRGRAPVYEVDSDGNAMPTSGEAAASRKERFDLSGIDGRPLRGADAKPQQNQATTQANSQSPEQVAQSIWDGMNSYERNNAAVSTLKKRGILAKNAASRNWEKLDQGDKDLLVASLSEQQGQRWTDPNQKATDSSLPVLQNRDRSSAASIEQVSAISAAPDYFRAGVSRDFGNGAPVLEESEVLPEQQIGRSDVSVTAQGRQIPVKYAVVEAQQILPSNTASGASIPEYSTGQAGKLRAIAGNGRSAGLIEGWRKGTTESYLNSMLNDDLHGIDPDVIRGMNEPILVRLMQSSDVTENIGDESNIANQATLGAIEQAKTDARRIDLSSLEFDEDNITDKSLQGFIAGMPISDRSALMDGKLPSKQARARMEAAIFQQAYGNDELTRVQAQAITDESRNIVHALMQAAPAMSKLDGAGEFDIRALVSEAASVAVNARRSGAKLKDYIAQNDFGRNPAIQPLLEMMAANINSAKNMAEKLKNLAAIAYAESMKGGVDLFGEVKKPSVSQLMNLAFNGVQIDEREQNTDGSGQGNLGQQGRAESHALNVEQPTTHSGRTAGGKPIETAQPEPASTNQQEVKTEPWRRNYIAAAKRARQLGIDPKQYKELSALIAQIEMRNVPKLRSTEIQDDFSSDFNQDFDLTTQTEAELSEQAERIKQAENEAKAEQAEQDAEAKNKQEKANDKQQADATLDNFELGQSGEAQLSGMGDMFAIDQAANEAATDPDAFIKTKDGEMDFGEITPEMAKAAGRQAGKIRLQEGIQNPDGTGYGLAHIEANHGKQIRALGFSDAVDFVQNLAGNFSEIWKAKSGQLLVTVNDGRKDVMFIQLSPSENGDFYRVNSAFPVRQKDYEQRKGMEKLWGGSEPAPVATGQQPAFATETPNKPSEVSPNARSQSSGASVGQNGQAEQGSNPAEPIDEKEATQTQPAERIEDFGEKISGARKDYASKLKDAQDLDVATSPFAKAWPEPNYQKLLDGGMKPEHVALIRAIRDEIPAKPRHAWKLKQWVKQVQTLRESVTIIMADPDSASEFAKRIEENNVVSGITGRASLYEALGHEESLKDYSLKAGSYGVFNGVRYSPNKTFWTVSKEGKGGRFETILSSGETKAEALADYLAKRKTAAPKAASAAKGTTFDIYTDRTTKEAFIGKKIGTNIVRIKTGFATVKEARLYKAAHQAELEERLAKLKDVPNERNETNAPRVGIDHRNGANVTPEQFGETFGFRGVQFGNSVEQKRRQQDLNDAYDGLMDLAGILNLPPKALSLNGELALAFGARGIGGKHPFKAHYEPGEVVINLTKGNGAGSLAHEWWHALDNYFAKDRNGGKAPDFYGTEHGYHSSTRQEMKEAFAAIASAVNRAGIKARSQKLDTTRTKAYWSTGREMTARAFESYIIEKLRDQNQSNDYLANIVSEDYWNAAAALGVEKGNTYPYPEAAELPGIRAAYESFFQTIEHKETDDGDVLLFSRTPATKAAYESRIDALFNGSKPNQHGVTVLDRSDVLDLLGFGDMPVVLNEKHAIDDGKFNHPLTAEQWKRIPDYLENPVAVFERGDGNLTFVTSELVDGKPLIVGISPEVGMIGGRSVAKQHLLLTAYVRDRGDLPVKRMINDGELRYVDTRKSPEFNAGSGLQIPSSGIDLRGLGYKVHTGADLFKYRQDNQTNYRMDAPDVVTSGMPRARVQAITDKVLGGKNNDVIIVQSFKDLPEDVKRAIGLDGTGEGDFNALHYKGKSYIVADAMKTAAEVEAAIFHEHYTHGGLRAKYGKDLGKKLDDMLTKAGGIVGLRMQAKKQGINLHEYEKALARNPSMDAQTKKRILMEELLAHMSATTGTLRRKLEEVLGAIRQWLRDNGFAELAKLRASDIAYTLKQAREAVQTKTPAKETAVGDAPAYSFSEGTELGITAEQAKQQFADTEKAYGGKAAYGKAKEAGKTKLNYHQWVQVRTPAFKAWFGDWEAVRAQKRLDDMKPVQVRVPDEWKSLPVHELRQRVEDSLLELMHSGEPLHHPEAGDVAIVRKGIKKALASSADPAKLQVLGDLRRAFESSILASSQAAKDDAPNVLAYDKLIASLNVGGADVVAVFTVKRLTDGSQFYNTVALDNGQEKTPVASPRDTLTKEERATSANTGVSSFIRRPLERVNPDSVSKVIDPDTGEPLVVYHGTGKDFTEFKEGVRQSLYGGGIYFGKSPDVASSFASPLRGPSPNVMSVYLNLQNPYIEQDADYSKTPKVSKLKELGHDGIIAHDGQVVAFYTKQIKSATGNTGQFNQNNPDINYLRAFHGSPHLFNEFDLEKIGDGVGAQAFGHGLYFSGREDVARFYKEQANGEGNLYQVDIPEVDDLLDYGLPLNQQSSPVRAGIKAMLKRPEAVFYSAFQQAVDQNGTGEAIYQALAHDLGNQQEASAVFNKAGIPGLTYQGFEHRVVGGKESRNYVIWDDSLIDMEAINGQRAQAQALLYKSKRASGSHLLKQALVHESSVLKGLQLPNSVSDTRGSGKVLTEDDILSNDDPVMFSRTSAARDNLASKAEAVLNAADKWADRERVIPNDWTDAQKAAAGKFDTFTPRQPFSSKLKQIRATGKDRFVQKVFDQFRPLKSLSKKAYMQAQLAKGHAGALEAVATLGTPYLKDGAIAVRQDENGFIGKLSKLGDMEEVRKFLMWVAANRAEKLMSEGRENLFSRDDIDAMKAFATGTLKDGRARAAAYAQAAQELRKYNKAVLDIAEQAGLVNSESRAEWESEFYIPFYRVLEDENGTPSNKHSHADARLVRQEVIKRLKGGTDNLGDPLENILANWGSLLGASMRNMAASEALNEGESLGISSKVGAQDFAGGERGDTWTMQNGQRVYWHVYDAPVMEALEAMNFTGYDNPFMKAAGAFKRALTTGVTISPVFRANNLVRDLVHSMAVADVSYNPLKNLADGWKMTGKGTDSMAQLLAGGGAIRFGSFTDGNAGDVVKRMIKSGIEDHQILNTSEKFKNALTKFFTGYQEFGDRAETVNRAAVYQRVLAETGSHLEASFAARDLMNFSSMGSAAVIRAMAQVLPFFNARLQGMDRLVRGAADNPMRFAKVVGVLGAASALLFLMQADDDEYKALPDYVRDTYWPIKLGGTWLYIPKPFEVGALATVIERGTELMTAGNDYQAKDFAATLTSTLVNTLAMNPEPQIIRPAMESWFNYDMFRGRPIDSMGMERLLPQDRYDADTSAGAVALGQALNSSPQKIEHMVRGYFGWLGLQALNVADIIGRSLTDMPASSRRDLSQINNWFVVGNVAKESGTLPSKYVERFYDMQREINELYQSANAARMAGNTDRYNELMGDPKMKARNMLNSANNRITLINRQIKAVTARTDLSAKEKNEAIQRLNERRNAIAKQVDDIARA